MHLVLKRSVRLYIPPLVSKAMKLVVILMTVFLLQASASGVAQKVTLSMENVKMEKVFKAIERQTGYGFLFTRKTLEKMPRVSVHVREATIESVLEECLAGKPLDFVIRNKTIVINPNPATVVILPEMILIDVNGRVLNEDGQPVPGVSVLIKGTQKGTTTNENGYFNLSDVDENATLLFSGANIETQQVKLEGRTVLNVRVRKKITLGEEITVELNTGYQTLPKERATGSFAYTGSKDLSKQLAVTDISEKFRTLLPGVLMSDGTPIIRGKTTINANQSPIIVIDGFPTDVPLTTINPNDVESITVLRDAAAASIWGVKASNGVIVITTKKGTNAPNGKPQISFNSSLTFQSLPDLSSLKLANSSDFVDVELEALDKGWFNLNNPENNSGYSPVYEIYRKQKNGEITEAEANAAYNKFRSTNYESQKDLFFRTGMMQQYNLSISGAGNKNRYYASLNYQNNQPNSKQNKDERFTFLFKNTYDLFPKLIVDASINLSLINSQNNGVSVYQFQGQRPYRLFVDENGNYLPLYEPYRSLERMEELKSLGYLDWANNLKRDFDNNDNETKNFSPRLNIGINYNVLPFLSYESRFQYERNDYRSDSYYNEEMYYTRDLINQFTVQVPGGGLNSQIPKGPIYYATVHHINSISWRNQLKLNKTFDGAKTSNLNAIIGTEVSQNQIDSRQDRYHNYSKEKLTYDLIDEQKLAAGVTGWNGQLLYYPALYKPIQQVENRYFSMYFNGSYEFDKKYILSASARIDKSNLFGASTNDKMTPLYSVGAAWHISNEDFFKVKWINDLKLRVTTGVNGNVDKQTSKVLIAIPQNNSYTTGEDYLKIEFPENKELRWESTTINNLGIDVVLFKNRISASFDVYAKNSYDLLGFVDADPSVGFEKVYKNTAELKNVGYDLRISANIIRGTFDWDASLSLSHNKNKVTKVFNPTPSVDNYLTGGRGREIKGKPIDYFYNYKWAGLTNEGEPQVYNDKGEAVSWQTGGIQPNVNWLKYAGTTLPTYFGTLMTTLSYKGFSLTPIAIFRFGNVMRLPTGYVRSVAPVMSDIGNRWKKPGDENFTWVPRLFDNMYEPYIRRQFYASNDNRTASASFIRLSSVSLTYDISRIFHTSVFRNIQLQGQVTDAAIWVKNKENVDPEAIDLRYGNLGIRTSPTYTLGLKLDF